MEAVEVLIENFELKNKNLPFFIYQDKNIYETLLGIISLYHGPNSVLK